MQYCRRRITKEQYERAIKEHNGYIAPEDKSEIFTSSELLGYGVYTPIAHKDGEDYFVSYSLGDTCD